MTAATMAPGDDILVVMPCLNEAETLPRLLDQILAEDGNLLVVVADGGSTDGTRALAQAAAARDPRVVLLANPRRLQSAGVNAVVEQFAGRAQVAWCGWTGTASYPPGPDTAAGLARTALRVDRAERWRGLDGRAGGGAAFSGRQRRRRTPAWAPAARRTGG